MLQQLVTTITVHTEGHGLHEITGDVQSWLAASGFDDGLLNVFDGNALFRQQDEAPDDMPAHVRAALTAKQLSLPLQGRRLVRKPGRASVHGSVGCEPIGARSPCIWWGSEWPTR